MLPAAIRATCGVQSLSSINFGRRYDAFTGNSSEYLQWQDSTFYNKTVMGNKWAWSPVPCNNSYASICEVPHTRIVCPVSWACCYWPA